MKNEPGSSLDENKNRKRGEKSIKLAYTQVQECTVIEKNNLKVNLHFSNFL